MSSWPVTPYQEKCFMELRTKNSWCSFYISSISKWFYQQLSPFHHAYCWWSYNPFQPCAVSCLLCPLTSLTFDVLFGLIHGDRKHGMEKNILWTGVLYAHNQLRSGVSEMYWLAIICVPHGHATNLWEPQFWLCWSRSNMYLNLSFFCIFDLSPLK